MPRGVLLMAALAGTGLLGLPAAIGAPAPACSWPMYGHDLSHTFNQPSTCTTVGAATAPRLRPKWFVRTRDSVSASPTVVGGTVYVGSWDGVMHAIDAASGAVRWTYAIDDAAQVAFGRIVASAAVVPFADERGRQRLVVLFGGGVTLYALDASSGALLARLNVDPRTAATKAKQPNAGRDQEVEIESSPMVADVRVGGKTERRIYFGMDVHNDRGVGRTGVISARLGQRGGRWRFDPLWKFDPETSRVYRGRPGLTVGSGRGFGCGGVWSTPVVDEQRGLVFFGTSSCSHGEDARKAGENWVESMFAIRAGDGSLVWKHTPADTTADAELDHDFGSSPNLFRTADGRALVGEGRKDARYYARDRTTGKAAWTTLAGAPGYVQPNFAIGGYIGSPAVDLDGRGRGRSVIGATAFPVPLTNPDSSGADGLDRTTWAVRSLDAATGRIAWTYRLTGPSYGHTSIAGGAAFVVDTVNVAIVVLDVATGLPAGHVPLLAPPSSGATVIGDSVYVGIGTRETDAEFKAFGNGVENLFADTIGPHPLSVVSGIQGFTIGGGP